jgi:ADP-ribose pyrophosphatase YjhB (NUDIX family)
MAIKRKNSSSGKPDSVAVRVVTVPRSGKDLSVMAWIEDAFGHVLMVKQKRGKRSWSFPGGKVGTREGLTAALYREIKEETGLSVEVAAPVDIYDRASKGSVAILFRVLLKKGRPRIVSGGEIEKIEFKRSLPKNATPSAHYFWGRAQYTFDPLSLLPE